MKTQKKRLIITQALMALSLLLAISTKAASPYYYQIKVYHFKTDAQEKRLDNYFQNAFVPAVHRIGIKEVGVFKPITQDTDKRIYVFIPAKSWEQLEGLEEKLLNDQTYLTDGADYINASYNDYPYSRIETIVLRAFRDMLQPAVPKLTAPKAERVYELRSYENPSEKAGVSKIKMMNEGGEVKLFDRLGFNAMFYGKVIIGGRMPNMMYMTTFNSKEQRDAHWKQFADAPEWKAIVGLPEYQHNLNKADVWFLYPVVYSDF